MTDPLWGRSLLPGNATPLERVLSEAFAEIFAGLPDPASIPAVLRHQDTPTALLPWLAWEWSVDEWQPQWTEQVQRGVIAASWDIHSHKGTVYALERAVDALGYGAVITEWWQTGGDPYTFRYAINGGAQPWQNTAFDSLYRVALRTKNVRSWLEGTDLSVTGSTVPLHVGAIVKTRVRVSPSTEAITTLSALPAIFSSAVVRTRVRVKPPG